MLKVWSPWLIAILGSLAMFVSNGMAISGLSVFDESLLNEFSWTRGELKFRDLITLVVTGLAAPLAGVLIDRFGVRACMLVGWLVLAGGYYLYSQLSSLSELYFIHLMFAIVLVFCGLNAVVILVSSWFSTMRGSAIGIALVGTSLGGAFMPQLGNTLNQSYGWRQAMAMEMCIPLWFLLVTALLIRNRPEDWGARAWLRGPGADKTDRRSPLDTGMKFAEAVKTRTFWAIAVTAMLTFYSVLGISAHLFLYMRDSGFSAGDGANALSIFFLSALVGKLVFGFLGDMMNRSKVFWGNYLVMLVGAVALASMRQDLIWVAIFAFGLGWGGLYTMIQLSAVNAFGLRDAGKILGVITVLDASGGGLGIWLSGVLYDRLGSYDVPFMIFLVLLILAGVCISQIKELDSNGMVSKA
jgi:sugar phosphate permease